MDDGWMMGGGCADLAALLAHDANAHIGSLDHGHVIGPIPDAQHLATQAALLALQPPLHPGGPTFSLLHLHHTHACISAHAQTVDDSKCVTAELVCMYLC